MAFLHKNDIAPGQSGLYGFSISCRNSCIIQFKSPQVLKFTDFFGNAFYQIIEA
jgi:hypothetical protein